MGGIQCRNRRKHDGRVLFLGPKNSGKTTALYYLKFNQSVTTMPTPGYNVETIELGRTQYEVWDISGTMEKRDEFLRSAFNVSAVVFFIDCSKGEKGLSIALRRLDIMLAEEELHYCPVAIVANKQDLQEDLVDIETISLALKEKECMQARYWNIFPCSALFGDGLTIMAKWVDDNFGMEKPRILDNENENSDQDKQSKPKKKTKRRRRRRRRRKVQHDQVY